jgi:tRNA(Ile)-lysidine synthase
LGPLASEDKARKARYNFLHKVRRASNARSVITAHHKDDALETTILHLVRGTGRRGLGSLRSTDTIKRPLLDSTKHDLIDYAESRQLAWREDPTNQSTNYFRNYVRHQIIPRLSAEQKQQLHQLISSTRQVNQEADSLLDLHLHLQPHVNQLDKKWFISLAHPVASEVMAHWLRRHGIRSFDKKLLEKLVIGAKTLAIGKTININKEYNLRVKSKVLALEHIER